MDKSMKAESQLHVAKFPMIRFSSTTITAETQDRFLVTGQLTIRGVTKAVQFPAKVVMTGKAFRGTATLELAQSAFGYKPYSALLGAIKNKDGVTLHIDLVAVPEEAGGRPASAPPVDPAPADSAQTCSAADLGG